MKENQNQTPYLDALKKYLKEGVSPFDVPGHHMGNVENDFKDFIGDKLFQADVNAPRGLDNLNHPSGVLVEAQHLMADAYGADEAFFLINGTSSGILAMIMAVCSAHKKIIIPRNSHKSVINALVLSGATPIFITPEYDADLEIANQPSLESYYNAIDENPDAMAIFVINPTYFGVALNLKELVNYAHEKGMIVLADEAHGAHLAFEKDGPISAMEAGCDLSAVSVHKTLGSLTQSSILLRKGDRVSHAEIFKTLAIINSTSPSTILLASLDAARKYMATKGIEKQKEAILLADEARAQINQIPGISAKTKDYFKQHGCYDFDETKLVISLDSLDIDGFALYNILKDDYGVQVELAEAYVILCIFAIGTKKEHVERLIAALKDISSKHYVSNIDFPKYHYRSVYPEAFVRPRTAYHAPLKMIPLEEAERYISKESIMIYPPGIPLIIPGEIFTEDIIHKIQYYKKHGATVLSDDPDKVSVIDFDTWDLYEKHKKDLEEYYNSLIASSSLKAEGYSLPFEGNEHKGTIVLLPYRKDTWREDAIPALKEFRELVSIISKYEKVYLGVDPSIDAKKIKPFKMANVEIVSVPYNDSWARDNTLIYVQKEGKNLALDFRFNAWGGDFDGLYKNYQDDDDLGKKLVEYLQDDIVSLKSFILEGGSIHSDGEGTLITTKACLLSKGRNSNLTPEQIETVLKNYLGIEKVLWLEHGIYNDETDEHIDNMACFLKPGVIALATCDDVNDPQYAYSKAAEEYLSHVTDAKGRKLEIVKIPVPTNLKLSKEEAEGIVPGTDPIRPVGNRLAASYINFYQGKNFLIMPKFNVKEDEYAYQTLKKFYKDKKVYQLYSREILLGGGNIHCVTMQIPKEK